MLTIIYPENRKKAHKILLQNGRKSKNYTTKSKVLIFLRNSWSNLIFYYSQIVASTNVKAAGFRKASVAAEGR